MPYACGLRRVAHVHSRAKCGEHAAQHIAAAALGQRGRAVGAEGKHRLARRGQNAYVALEQRGAAKPFPQRLRGGKAILRNLRGGNAQKARRFPGMRGHYRALSQPEGPLRQQVQRVRVPNGGLARVVERQNVFPRRRFLTEAGAERQHIIRRTAARRVGNVHAHGGGNQRLQDGDKLLRAGDGRQPRARGNGRPRAHGRRARHAHAAGIDQNAAAIALVRRKRPPPRPANHAGQQHMTGKLRRVQPQLVPADVPQADIR